MLFNIPQFIDKEDKIVGPLTAKQLGWMFAGGTILLILYGILDMAGFIVAAIPVCALTGALAFYHPNGQPLIGFILSSISFLFHPKMYVWRRTPEKEVPRPIAKKITPIEIHKEPSKASLEEISKALDQRQ